MSNPFGIQEDESMIVFANPRERSTGFFEFLDNCDEVQVYKRDGGQIQLPELPEDKVIDASSMDALDLVSSILEFSTSNSGIVNIDISILNRVEFLYLLNMVDRIGKYDSIRLLYSEPENYLTDEKQNPTIGIKEISSIPSFVNESPLNKPLLLILMLGYEPARSLAIYNNIDPDRTYLIVPHPPYKEEWTGRTERKNSELLTTVREENIMRMHSIKPDEFATQFNQFVEEEELDMDKWTCRISPLSTKPQALGLFKYWRENKGDFSLIYSSPLKEKKLFQPVGISIDNRHVLKTPEI